MFGKEASPRHLSILPLGLHPCHMEESSSQTPLGPVLRSPPASPTLGPRVKRNKIERRRKTLLMGQRLLNLYFHIFSRKLSMPTKNRQHHSFQEVPPNYVTVSNKCFDSGPMENS